MAYNNATRTFTVGTDDELNAAIANLDAIGKTGNNNELSAGDYTIRFEKDITLDGTAGGTYAAQNADGSTGQPLTLNSGSNLYTVAGSSQLYALNLTSSTTVTIDGGGFTLDGNGANTTGAQAYNGFFVYNGQVAIQNLTIAHAVAQGGAGGGGGAGLGGGLFVAGPNATSLGASTFTTGGNVTLTNVNFSNNVARGGAGGDSGGGGGLQGGSTVSNNAGGVGIAASGALAGGSGGGGLILGAAPGGGANGGSNGGGGSNPTAGGGVGGANQDYTGVSGGFGGGGGGSGGFGTSGGFGGGGGVGGTRYGGYGGFGGGGAGPRGEGGFGGGRAGGYTTIGGFSDAGGGGLGAGADVFVQQGGSLTIRGNSTLGAGTVVGGTGESATAGSGLGSGLFIQGNQSVTLAPGAGQTLTVNGVVADQNGSLGQLTVRASFSAGSGSLNIGAGTVVLAPVTDPDGTTVAANTYTGGTIVTGGTVAVASDTALGAPPSPALLPNRPDYNGIDLPALPNGLTLDGGTLKTTADGFASARGITLGAGGGTVQVETGSATLSGAVNSATGAGSASFTKTGIGTLVLTGTNSFAGGTTIAGGTLQLGAAGAAGTGAISFGDLSGNATATLSLTQAAQPTNTTFSNTLVNFGTGSRLDLQGLANGTVSYNATNSQITVTGLRSGAQVSQIFTLSNTGSTNFIAQSNGQGGTVIAVCFVTGTRIRTVRGEVAVEDLRVGDRAVTASGALRPVTWIGHRHLAGGTRALPTSQQPVRIRAGAFGPGLPARDLRLSPGHPVLVGAEANGAGGHLVPIMCLINGTSIARELVASITYWHVELDSHDILLAEGLPAESYLDWGDRSFFTEASDHALHNPDFVVPGLSARCRPVAVDGPVVEAERARLLGVFAAALGDDCAWDEPERFTWIAA